MLRPIFTALLLVASTSGTAFADTAGKLLSQCEAADRLSSRQSDVSDSEFFDGTFCIGYIRGAVEQMQAVAQVNPKACPPVPVSVSSDQAFRIVLKHLRDHPEHHHWQASGEVFVALAIAFPCGAQQPK
jgi:hypothetical protein